MTPAIRQKLSDIAVEELGIPTLEMRGSDSLDFHEVSVASLADALALAFQAGQTAEPVKLPEFKQQAAYNLSFHAPAGIYRDLIIADTPQEALARARKRAEAGDLPADGFDPVAESYCVHQITVEDPDDGDQLAIWTDPDHFAAKHAPEILDYLESIINEADGLQEKRHEVDGAVSDIAGYADEASRRIEILRVQEGVQ